MGWFFLSAYTGCTVDAALKRFLHLMKYPHTVLFSLFSCLAFLTAFDDPIRIVKGCILVQILIIAGFLDCKTREIPDWLSVCAALCGFLSFHPLDSLAGAAWVFAALMIYNMIYDFCGGGDIKLLAGCGFALGTWGALFAAFITFLFFFIANFSKSRKNSRQPLVPFIAVGCFLAYLIS